MKRQNKIIGRIGPVLLRRIDSKRFSLLGKQPSKKEIRNRLLNFLNLNVQNTNEIEGYCQKNGYIPYDWSKGWMTAFVEEHQELMTVAEKMARREITEELMRFVVSKVKDRRIMTFVVPESSLARFNEEYYLGSKGEKALWYPVINELSKKTHIVDRTVIYRFQAYLWQELEDMIRMRKPIRRCAEVRRCSRYFIPNVKTVNRQLFCSPECEDRNRQRTT